MTRRYSPRLLAFLPLLLGTSCRHDAPPPSTAPAAPSAVAPVPVPDDTDWHAVAAGAEQTLNRYHFLNTPDPNDNIPADLWAPSLAQLHPLRVHENAAGNVEIVLKESAGEEEGVYVVPAISSTSPSPSDFTTLHQMDNAAVYKYTRRAAAEAPGTPSR